MLSNEKHCDLLVRQITERKSHVLEGFKLFAQMFSAIVGGSVALRLQQGHASKSFAIIADGLAILIFAASTAIVLENLRGWYGLRRKLSEVAGRDENHQLVIPPPRARASTLEIALLTVMLLALIAFVAFNPLKNPN